MMGTRLWPQPAHQVMSVIRPPRHSKFGNDVFVPEACVGAATAFDRGV
jgi:hypothetical protein